jgi:hypothetical protein
MQMALGRREIFAQLKVGQMVKDYHMKSVWSKVIQIVMESLLVTVPACKLVETTGQESL